MPKSVQRCSTNMSHSSNVPSSSSSSMRSRAVSLPLACCASMRFSPPPRRAPARFFSSCSMMSCMCGLLGILEFRSSGSSRSSSRRAATDAATRPASTSAVSAGSAAAHRRVLRESAACSRRRCVPTSRPAPARGAARRAGRWRCAARAVRSTACQNSPTPAPFSALSCSTRGIQCRRLLIRGQHALLHQRAARRDLRLRARRGGGVEVGLVDRPPGRPAPSRPS